MSRMSSQAKQVWKRSEFFAKSTLWQVTSTLRVACHITPRSDHTLIQAKFASTNSAH